MKDENLLFRIHDGEDIIEMKITENEIDNIFKNRKELKKYIINKTNKIKGEKCDIKKYAYYVYRERLLAYINGSNIREYEVIDVFI